MLWRFESSGRFLILQHDHKRNLLKYRKLTKITFIEIDSYEHLVKKPGEKKYGYFKSKIRKIYIRSHGKTE